MRTDLVRVCAAALGIVLFASAQDMCPAVLGAKAPFLLSFGCVAGIPAAFAAGLVADSLDCLPFGCSAVFFLAAAILARVFRRAALPLTFLSAGAFQLWLSVWTDVAPSVSGVCGALLSAVAVVPAMAALVGLARRRIGIGGVSPEGRGRAR